MATRQGNKRTRNDAILQSFGDFPNRPMGADHHSREHIVGDDHHELRRGHVVDSSQQVYDVYCAYSAYYHAQCKHSGTCASYDLIMIMFTDHVH